MQVRPDRLEEYRERHRAVWPEMLAALREAGWGNYSLFFGERADEAMSPLEEVFHLA